jgi:hypothetical protein
MMPPPLPYSLEIVTTLNMFSCRIGPPTRILFSLCGIGRDAVRYPAGSEAAPVRVRHRHSDFADPKGPLLTPSTPISRQGYQDEALASLLLERLTSVVRL